MAGNVINRTSSTPMKTILPPQEILDDLCSRFVLNVPKEDLESFERIFFLLEQAHWFYEDNSVEQNPSLKSLSFKEFSSLMFNNCAALRPYINHLDDIYKDFTTYKFRVPVSGAIILDESYERCLLVKGWKSGSSWSFPRGKKSKDEEDHICAYREDGCSLPVIKLVGFPTAQTTHHGTAFNGIQNQPSICLLSTRY
ncbi:mRNA-decapping enzyme subunit 2 [Dendrobium catenatum]|uniref:mRNA-decapping enzyme subunit 2 n=1 Tax=Dendrobium catenatum TaxID=906689 RepID=A0A2I0WIM8_9ASPA|nr:mRNA-decapping enzyme subunit 2 [Dendrobium catenatum]